MVVVGGGIGEDGIVAAVIRGLFRQGVGGGLIVGVVGRGRCGAALHEWGSRGSVAIGIVLGLFAQDERVRSYDLDASVCGEIVGLAQRGGREGALAFAAGEAVAVSSGVVAATIDVSGAVCSRAGAWFGWVGSSASVYWLGLWLAGVVGLVRWEWVVMVGAGVTCSANVLLRRLGGVVVNDPVTVAIWEGVRVLRGALAIVLDQRFDVGA